MHWERNQAEMLMGTLEGGQYVACTKISFDFFSLFFSFKISNFSDKRNGWLGR